MSRIGVVAALACEKRTLDRVRPGRRDRLAAAGGAMVGVSGPGADGAAEAASSLLEAGADCLLSWGLAGALVDRLGPGTVIVPKFLVGSDGVFQPASKCWWRQTVRSVASTGPVRSGKLAESRKALVRRAEKRALHAATDALAVDMESAAVARVAAAADVPFLCIRVIADTLDQDVPAWIPDLLEQSGRVAALRTAGRTLSQPRDWQASLRLALAGWRALTRLRRIAPLALDLGELEQALERDRRPGQDRGQVVKPGG